MVKNNHIYALNYDLKSVQQNQSSTSLVCKATTDYYLNEKEAPPKYRMIKDIDDILKLKLDKDELEVYLVPELNNLHELFFKVIGSGYEPKITFQAGIITEMRLKLKKVKYIIKTQNLVKSSGDGCIAVRDEVTYNRMNEAMFKFNKSLFNPIHKSHYNDTASFLPMARLRSMSRARTSQDCWFTSVGKRGKWMPQVKSADPMENSFTGGYQETAGGVTWDWNAAASSLRA